MENKVLEIKAAFAAIVPAIAAALGWKGPMVVAWVALMALDYITGTMAALKVGDWNSKRAREGIWHKSGEMVVVIVAAIADGIIFVICGNIPILNIAWPAILLPLILAWYILTELGSILENSIAMGANPPNWLARMITAGKKAVENAAAKELDPWADMYATDSNEDSNEENPGYF